MASEHQLSFRAETKSRWPCPLCGTSTVDPTLPSLALSEHTQAPEANPSSATSLGYAEQVA